MNPRKTYWIARSLLVRSLGLLYLNIFLILIFQGIPLLGESGLLPIQNISVYLNRSYSGNFAAFVQNPSLFQFFHSDLSLKVSFWIGLLASLPLIAGFVNFPILFTLWIIQLSVVNSGQLFYSYGWETQILELTFLSFFLCPLWDPRLFRANSSPKNIAIYFQRWMLFRLMLGAGLIKLRGDPCWSDLTCLVYHYETQPIPHIGGWLYHQMPIWFHKGGVIFNHFVELIVPFGILGPRKIRHLAGLIMIMFQLILISSGNLSWLNWVTLFMVIPCFDDQFFLGISKKYFVKKIPESALPLNRGAKTTLYLFMGMGLILSIQPALNLISSGQMMNASFDRLHLINTYGAFGSIGKVRNEIIISGTDNDIYDETITWKEYEFKCKPGRLDKAPCLITPYHYRLDWQIWFSAMRPKLSEQWLLRFAKKLLKNDDQTLSLIAENPFHKRPPKWLKMDLYEYKFTVLGDENWWRRSYLSTYMFPMSLKDLTQVN